MFTLKDTKKFVGIKQTVKAVKDGVAKEVYIAENADSAVTAPLIELCKGARIPIKYVATTAQLGQACGISIGCSAAAII